MCPTVLRPVAPTARRQGIRHPVTANGAGVRGCVNGVANRLLRPAEVKAQSLSGQPIVARQSCFYEGAISNTSFLWGASSMDFSR